MLVICSSVILLLFDKSSGVFTDVYFKG